ncbi:MAG: hypothetical protein NT126_09540 [Bacteroidetes bacterium]|nr:hypothetical protein [Bacteroidota bacterium]
MKRIVLTVLILFSVFLSCKKENERPQWQVNVIGPLMHATLGVSNFIADSILHSDSTHAISLVYEDDLYQSNLDSLFQIRDTSIPTVFTLPIASIQLQPNTPFYSINNNAALNISGVELREAIIKSGYLEIEAHNRISSRVIYTYTIPNATLNGQVFRFTMVLNAAPPGGSSSHTGLFDMSGYHIDLTGASGNMVNTLAYNVAAQTDTGGTSSFAYLGDTLINISAGLKHIIPYYAKGYLGQKNIDEGNVSKHITPFEAIRSGSIRLQDVTMKFSIENNIGVDAQALIGHFQSVNTKTHQLVNLNAPQLVNHTININRATESGNAVYPVHPSLYEVLLDHTNSNIISLIENLPDQLNYSLNMKINPQGNISGSNDFVYSDYLVKAKIKVEMPLAFAADHLELADTTSLIIQNQADYDPVGSGTFTLIAVNGFPFEADLHLILLDAQHHFLDSIPVPSVIAAANVDANFNVTSPTRTVIPVYLDEARKNKILGASNIFVRAVFTTPSFPQKVQIYSGYHLDLKLTGDASYLIH